MKEVPQSANELETRRLEVFARLIRESYQRWSNGPRQEAQAASREQWSKMRKDFAAQNGKIPYEAFLWAARNRAGWFASGIKETKVSSEIATPLKFLNDDYNWSVVLDHVPWRENADGNRDWDWETVRVHVSDFTYNVNEVEGQVHVHNPADFPNEISAYRHKANKDVLADAALVAACNSDDERAKSVAKQIFDTYSNAHDKLELEFWEKQRQGGTSFRDEG